MTLVPKRSYSLPTTNSAALEAYPERANLYPLELTSLPEHLYLVRGESDGKTVETVHFAEIAGASVVEAHARNMRRALASSIVAALGRAKYRIGDRDNIVVDTTTKNTPHHPALQIYSSFELRVMDFNKRYYLCVNHRLRVRSVFSLSRIAESGYELALHQGQQAHFQDGDEWKQGRLLAIDGEYCRLSLMGGIEITLPTHQVIPRLSPMQVAGLAPAIGVSPRSLEQRVKEMSFLLSKNAPLERLAACTGFVERISEVAFPIITGGPLVDIDPAPAVLKSPEFSLGAVLDEVPVSFDRTDQTKRASDIVKGLTTFGAYEKPVSQLRLVVVTTASRASLMSGLVDRLNRGSQRYHGARRTFGSNFVVIETITCSAIDDYAQAIRVFVRAPKREECDVALVYLPKDEAEVSDPNHPYFRVKGLLVQEGIASQMIDEATLRNTDYRDLNIALKIFAKTGHAPWVLDEAMPGVDLFIGLSSSQVYRDGQISRVMGYVNVFDAYGRWRFYEGGSAAFRFEERLQHFGDLVGNSVASYKAENGGKLGLIHIHLTKPFSRYERAILANAVHAVESDAIVVFVWINPSHKLRLYDLSPGVGGHIARSRSLTDDPRDDEPARLYVTTTGENALGQKGMGTPVPLELTIWTSPEGAPLSLDNIRQQILSLTRLNWASSRNFCHEPITTKFAGEIARKMNAFMEDPTFTVDTRLRGVPWFL